MKPRDFLKERSQISRGEGENAAAYHKGSQKVTRRVAARAIARRTFWEEEEPPSTPRGQPMDARGQAKASDDEHSGVSLKSEDFAGSSLPRNLRAIHPMEIFLLRCIFSLLFRKNFAIIGVTAGASAPYRPCVRSAIG